MVTINYKDGRPFYEQVKEDLRRLVVSVVLRPGDKLPSVRELAGQLAINPNTIQRAYRELEAEGYICSVPGRGSFVREGSGAAAARQASRSEMLLPLICLATAFIQSSKVPPWTTAWANSSF